MCPLPPPLWLPSRFSLCFVCSEVEYDMSISGLGIYLCWWCGSLVWCMPLILEFLIIIPSNIYSTPFSVFCFPSGILIAYLLGHLILSYSSVFIFYSLFFFLSFSWYIFKVTDSFLSSVKFADVTANDNLNLYYCFSRVASSFNFFLTVSISLLKLLIWQWVMSNFYIGDFDIFLIVIWNSLSDSSNICALYESGSVDYFVSWHCGVFSITPFLYTTSHDFFLL